MKKVFHLIRTGSYSGAENVVLNISDLLTEFDHFYVSPGGQIDDVMKDYPIKHVILEKFDFKHIKEAIEREKPEIVHCHDVSASIYGAVLSNYIHSYGGKVISHLHNNDPRMRKINLRSVLYKLASKKFDQVIVVSKSVIDEFVFKFPKNKTTIIPNIVNKLRILNMAQKDEIDKYDIGFVGRLVEQKNPIQFLKIVESVKSQIPDLRVFMIGDGYMKSVVSSKIIELKLTDTVELLGYKSNPYPYMKKAKLIVMPSKFEGFGLVAVEAMLLGTPVLATPVGGLGEIISYSELLVKNYEDFSQRAIEILDNDDILNEISAKVMQRVEKINNISYFKKALDTIYKETV